MPTITFICYPRCSTCRKAQGWLDDNGVPYERRDISNDAPTAEELREWRDASGLPIRRLFNTSGARYRELGMRSRLDAGMTDEECYAALATDGMLVKRPILVIRDDDAPVVALFGFKEETWAQALQALPA